MENHGLGEVYSGQDVTPEWNAHLLERQRELEEEGMSMGSKRFEDRLRAAIEDGSYADKGAAKKLLEVGLEKFSKDLALVIEEANKKRGPKSAALRWVKRIGPAKAAYIALRTLFASAVSSETVQKAARAISKRVVDELRFRKLEAEAPELFKYRLSTFATAHYMHRSRSLDHTLKYAEVDCSDLEMTNSEVAVLGTFLIDRAIESTGFFEILTLRQRGTTQMKLQCTKETTDWLTQRNDILRLMHPLYPAMVVQPLPWGPGKQGGYRYALRQSKHLVRGSKREDREILDKSDMTPVYQALNLIQNTEWKVNEQVLRVLESVLAMGGGRAGLPSFEPAPETPRPIDIDTNPEALQEWKKKEHRRRSAEVQRVQAVLRFSRIRENAKRYSKEASLYFPHSLDFRGRIYPITTDLSPQGDDLQKGLLHFAHGKPLGESGARYLAIHGANAWGKLPDGRKVSKLTLDEREEAIRHYYEHIQKVAQDPLNYNLWMDADEPWVFLAFCFEWAAAWYHVERMGEPAHTFVSHLPVAADGTCNGLQHFAALLRDPVAAEAVNVLNNSRPNDIYQTVADVVLEKLERCAVDEPMASLWLSSGLVNRSLTKRPTMTLAYGAKQFGFADQLMDYLKGLTPDQLKVFEKVDEDGETRVDYHRECIYMAKLIWDSLGNVVVSAQEGMAWFQAYARAVAKGNMNPTWRVPGTGFVARQNAYKVNSRVQVSTVLCGKAYSPTLYNDTKEVDPVSAANGISPNIIHSLDAAALMTTVIAAADAGVTSFAMIHDSYGTHAADAELLGKVLRQAFFRLYKEDVLGNLEEQFKEQLEVVNKKVQEEAAKEILELEEKTGKKSRKKLPAPIELPEPPAKGNLDLSKVLVSDYFFC